MQHLRIRLVYGPVMNFFLLYRIIRTSLKYINISFNILTFWFLGPQYALSSFQCRKTFAEYVLETTCREVAALSFEQQLQIRALFDKQRGNKFNYTYLSIIPLNTILHTIFFRLSYIHTDGEGDRLLAKRCNKCSHY